MARKPLRKASRKPLRAPSPPRTKTNREPYFRELAENIHEVFFVLTPGKAVHYISPAYEEVWGRSRESLYRHPNSWIDAVHPEDRARVIAAVKKSPFHGEVEYRILRPDGDVRWISARIFTVRNARGRPVRVAGIAEDVTAQRQEEDSLRRSEKLLDSFFRASSAGMLLLDEKLRYVRVNETLADINGVPVEKHIGRTVSEVLPKLAPVIVPLMRQVLDEKRVVTRAISGEVPRSPGTYRHWIASYFPVFTNPISVGGIVVDITDQKQTEEALRQSERRFQETNSHLNALITAVPDLVLILDEDGRYIDVWASHEILLYADPSKMLGRTMHEVMPPEYADLFLGVVRETIRTEKSQTLEYRLPVAAGERFFEGRTALLKSRDGEKKKVMWISRDITARHMAEQALKQSQANLAEAQRMTHLGSWELDLTDTNNINANSLRWSDEVFRIFGHEPGTVTVSNETFFQAVHPDDRGPIQEAVAEAVAGGTSYSIDHRIILPDGSERWVHEQSQIVRDPATGRPLKMLGTIQDITERKELEDRLRQSQRMESIGRLAGGVAHDMNNTLTVIQGFGEMLLRGLPENDPNRQYAQQVMESSQHAAAVTKQLLAFSRRQVLRPEVLNLNHVISHMERMLQKLIGEDVLLTLRLGNGLWSVRVDPTEMQQVIMNLAVNARDAMPRGGAIAIETENVEFKDLFNPDVSLPAGQYVTLTVTDTGTGMDETTRAHIFEPFFTTKGKDKGTGLGLSMVYGTVKQSGGDIRVRTAPGKGSSFRIYLPRHAAAPVAGPAPAPENPVRGGQETILLVEDEDAVRQVSAAMLGRLGYTVLPAKNREEAMDVLKAGDRRADLLITDLVLPRTDGKKVAAEARTAVPGLKVLFMSGYPHHVLGEHLTLEPGVHFLQKPFTIDKLAAAVRRAIEEPPPA